MSSSPDSTGSARRAAGRARLEERGRRCIVVEGDVAETDAVERMVTSGARLLRRIDIVVANAAIARDVLATELADEHWRRLTEIDLLGVFRCFRPALPHMIDRRSGRLLATSSISGAVQGWARHVHYSASKASVVGLVRAPALEVAAPRNHGQRRRTGGDRVASAWIHRGVSSAPSDVRLRMTS